MLKVTFLEQDVQLVRTSVHVTGYDHTTILYVGLTQLEMYNLRQWVTCKDMVKVVVYRVPRKR